MKKNLLIVLLLLFIKSIGFGQVNHNGDFQLWSYLSIEKELIKCFSSRLIGVMRWGDDVSTLYFAYGQWQLVYREKNLEIAPGYRHEYFRPNDLWLVRYNPMIDVTFFFPATWQLDDRNRVLYHIRDNLPNVFIYRNRLRLTTPQLTPCLKLRFFVDDEIFFQERRGFVQNRFCVGLFGEPTSWLKGRVYYMYRNLRVGDIWTYQNVFAFHLYF